VVPDDLHSPLVDSANKPGLLHLADIRVRQNLSSFRYTRLIGVDIRNVIELGWAFVVYLPTEV
jgi:hypothetical protein